ncbi:NAD(P)/FAD-dependent oxidoreductase [Leptospirillum ferriphilum]|uniref:FAD-binding domain-containing protein n=1 Tax=Leptospirillum ferriphilum TaxID=178606 RepID=A0A1V3SU37_9BACT|nr:geranylgeranyl reductase family protein [Leptospirillum ferriphilum]OOH71491.1 hypothetical protein BOX24_08195 [Leptospirillum ferriphilum]
MSFIPRSCHHEIIKVDAIVVGLGPAGATAIRLLSEAGLRVVGLDRAVFPRPKICGGGVSSRAIAFLPKGWDEIPHTVSTGVHLVFGDHSPVLWDMGYPIAYQFDRSDLDWFLLDRARLAGGEIRQGETIRSLAKGEEIFRLQCDSGPIYESRFLIGADGVTSSVLRFLAKSKRDDSDGAIPLKNSSHHMYPAAEVEISTQTSQRLSDVLIDLSSVSGGYGWSFSKSGGKKNVGVVGFVKPLKRPLETLRLFLETFPEREIFQDARGSSSAWLIPDYSRFDAHGKIPGLFLIGDAGAMVDPFLGEGIYYALLSGARAVSDLILHRTSPEKASRSYAQWAHSIFREFSYAHKLASVVYRFPGIYFRLAQRYPQVLSLYASVMTGKNDYRSFTRIIGKNLFKLPFRKAVLKFRQNRLLS